MRQPSFLWWRRCLRLQLKRSSFHLIQVPPLELHIDVWCHDVVHGVSSWDFVPGKAPKSSSATNRQRCLHFISGRYPRSSSSVPQLFKVAAQVPPIQHPSQAGLTQTNSPEMSSIRPVPTDVQSRPLVSRNLH